MPHFFLMSKPKLRLVWYLGRDGTTEKIEEGLPVRFACQGACPLCLLCCWPACSCRGETTARPPDYLAENCRVGPFYQVMSVWEAGVFAEIPIPFLGSFSGCWLLYRPEVWESSWGPVASCMCMRRLSLTCSD